MKFCFRKKTGNEEKTVSIVKDDSGDSVFIEIMRRGVDFILPEKRTTEYEKLVSRYNYAMIGNVRDSFDNLFPIEFSDLVRVIGITNTLGNYFTFFNNLSISIDAFKSYINDIKGFVFVDWDVVSKKSIGSQILYVTTDEETKDGESELKKYYDAGLIYAISYEIYDELGMMYCLDSSFLNKCRTPLINGLRNKVHQILLKRFP